MTEQYPEVKEAQILSGLRGRELVIMQDPVDRARVMLGIRHVGGYVDTLTDSVSVNKFDLAHSLRVIVQSNQKAPYPPGRQQLDTLLMGAMLTPEVRKDILEAVNVIVREEKDSITRQILSPYRQDPPKPNPVKPKEEISKGP